MRIVYVDGKFLPWEEAVIPVDDLAVLRGYAVCDVMRTFDGNPYFIDDHIRRLFLSAEKINIALPWSPGDIKAVVFKIIEKNRDSSPGGEPGTGEVNIRTIVTGGSSPDFFTPSGKPRLIVMATPVPSLPAWWYERGVKVITHHEERSNPEAKVTDYTPAARAMKKAKAANAVDALYISSENLALEATTSNLFAVISGTLVTPDQGVLKGITRKAVISLATPLMPVAERPLPLDELLMADEVFITGTNKGVVPVVQIDETIIAKGVPGSWTRKLIQALKSHAKNP
jgi:branched-chain amino acid aminotransferase